MPKKMKKSPLAAAVFNFIVWGLGYLYLGKRVAFGTILVLAELLSYFLAPFLSLSEEFMRLLTWSLPIWLLMSIAFAYDAYQEAS